MSNEIHKGDNTGFGGNRFITFTVKNPHLIPLNRIEFVVNKGANIAPKVFRDENNFTQEEIELTANFDGLETAKMKAGQNVGNVVCYDTVLDESTGDYRQGTCAQYITWDVSEGVICNVCQCKQ